MEVNVLAPIKKYEPRQQIPQSVWMSLGRPSCGARPHDLIREGLPFEPLERIASLLQVQQGAISKAICMSPTTLARRAKVGHFTTLENDRLVTMIAVFEKAISLFERDVAAAARWMSAIPSFGELVYSMRDLRLF